MRLNTLNEYSFFLDILAINFGTFFKRRIPISKYIYIYIAFIYIYEEQKGNCREASTLSQVRLLTLSPGEKIKLIV